MSDIHRDIAMYGLSKVAQFDTDLSEEATKQRLAGLGETIVGGLIGLHASPYRVAKGTVKGIGRFIGNPIKGSVTNAAKTTGYVMRHPIKTVYGIASAALMYDGIKKMLNKQKETYDE